LQNGFAGLMKQFAKLFYAKVPVKNQNWNIIYLISDLTIMASKKKKQDNKKKKQDKTDLSKGILVVCTILILHIFLIALVGCLVLFFRGVTEYMMWILIGCSVLIIFSGYYFYRRIKQEGRSLRRTLHSPMFSGRPIEISLLGGFASVKIGTPDMNAPMLGNDRFEPPRQLEGPATARLRELKELAHLLEKDMITLDEYNQTKQQLFNH